ncbi:MAG: molybdopterin-dependent oxidoreductase [Acidimicrobiales bacterium]
MTFEGSHGTTIHRITCTHDCPDACSALVTVTDGVAVDIRADSRHPVTGRHLCSKVDRYLERVYSPQRVMQPLRRTGAKGEGRFEPVSWADAIDEIAGRWTAIMAEHGGEALLPFSYLGSMGALSAFGPTHTLFHRLGATQLERAICGGQALAINRAMTTPLQADPELLVESRLIVCWGIDVVSTSIHGWDLIRRARKAGARLVVIDPYRSPTARRADTHLAIRPGTDGALALGLAHVIIAQGLVDRDFVDGYTTGFDAYAEVVAPWTPERTAAETGLAPEAVEDLAAALATTTPAAIRFGVGMQRADGAGSAVRAIQCLPALTGQWRHRGGGIVNARTMGLLNYEKLWGEIPPTRKVNMIQLGRVLTDAHLDPPVKALFVWNSNPAVITADQNRVLAGLARPDLFTVVHDLFVTDTARYADLVLPAPSMLEHDELVGSWGFNYVSRNRPAIAPLGQAKANAEVARLLARRLGIDDPVFALDDDELIRYCLDGSGAEAAGAGYDRLDDEGFVPVPHPGGDTPFARGGFPEPGGRFGFASEVFDRAFGLGRVPRYRPPAESPETRPDLARRYPLRLLTLKRPHSVNSSYGHLPVLLGAEPRTLIELNPADAATRGLIDGDPVTVVNDRGEVTGFAAVTDRVALGTVVVPFGRWLRDGPGANALTADRIGDLGGGPTFCDALVEVRPATVGTA